MRYKFIILFLLIGFVSKAQVYQLMPQYGYNTYRMNFDSTIQIPTFCGVPKLGSNVTKKGALAFDSCNNRFYFFNPKFQVWDTIKSADASLFVKYTDTAQMLSAYLRKTDTISLSNRIEGKIDSLKLSNDSVYARKNGQFVFQYMNDTATVVKAFVRNVENFTINRGQVVYIFGASGDKASVKLADNSGDITSSRTLGIVRESIEAGQTGWVTTQGQVGKLQLGAYNEGDILWLDSIPGGFTKTKPVAPRHSVFLGVVERANNGNGIVYVKPQNGYELGELHDVKITSPQTNEVLAYTTNIWENKNIYSIVDTTSLSNRINTKLNISDTSAMLSGYLRSIDTTNKYVTSVFRKTASDSVFFVRGGTNNFAFRDSAGVAGWGLTGNSGTSDATNFIGTTDNQDLVFRRNNVISGRIDSSSVNFGSTTFGFGTTGTSLSDRGITAFGYKALASNAATATQGIANTAVGNRALQNNNSGAQNTALGHNALVTLSGAVNDLTAVGAFAMENQGNGGGGSTAVGAYALRNQTFPSANTAVGAYALNLITNTGLNTAVGHTAGLYFGGSSSNGLTSSSSSTYLGYLTYAGANSQTNQTVIGANAVGAGSNTVTLGDNNITATYLKGTLGLGRTWTSSAPSVAASALLDMSSTTRGFLQPRMTNSEMNAISTPATGLSVFNTTDSLEYVYRGTSSGWQKNVTYTRTNDIGLLNGADQRLMIEPTTNIVAGRALTVEAGSTQAGGTSAFQALSQTTRNWGAMAAAPNGDIYCGVVGGDIFRRTGGTGNFVGLGQTTRNWTGMCAAPNGDIYASVFNGDIYKRTGGTGNFVALSQTTRNWRGMDAASNGDVYAVDASGDIYKQTGGIGNFIALGQASRTWYDVACAPNGDIYAIVDNGDIYKQTGGAGNFVALGQTIRAWRGIKAASNGDVYATELNGSIYKQTGGAGNFVSLAQTTRNWFGLSIPSNGDIYASVLTGDIYIQTAGTANLNGGTLVLQSGTGKGTGTSVINFNTSTPTVSGNALQNVSTKMTILGNGNVGIGTTSPSAKLELSDTARGFLQTRMTTTQMNAIASPSVGLQVFTTTDSSQYVYRGTGAGWQQIANEIVNTASLNFPSTNAQNSSDLTITLTGAVDGDAVVLGVPNAAVNANSCYTAWVSAANTVTVRFNNYSSGAIDPAQATFRVTIIK